jgi:PleD family two-component response regulator
VTSGATYSVNCASCRGAFDALEEFRTIAFKAADGTLFRQTFSAGIATLKPELNLEAWRQAADDALYEAKAAGRNRVLRAP